MEQEWYRAEREAGCGPSELQVRTAEQHQCLAQRLADEQHREAQDGRHHNGTGDVPLLTQQREDPRHPDDHAYCHDDAREQKAPHPAQVMSGQRDHLAVPQ